MPSKSSSRSTSTTTSNNSTPRYNLSINPPYQINYRAKRAGKHISATKRRITFQFGFSSLSAIQAGNIEVNCRGEEHEIVLIWSHITGKRELFMDGKSIHLSKVARGNTRFEYSWNMKGGNHVLKIIAHGTPPMGENSYKQFDLELDGMSYFTFAKIYELGNNIGRKSSSGRSGSRALTVATHSAPPQSYDYRGMAYDVRDDAEYEEEVETAPMSTVTTVDLFDTTQTTAQPQAIISPVTQYSEAASQSFNNNNSNSYNTQPSLTASSYSSSEYDEFAPVNVATQPKSFDSVSNEILSAYAVNNNTSAPPPCDVSNQSSSRALVPVSEENMDAITKSMKSLVNLDDITTQPFHPLSANNMKQQQSKTNSGSTWGSHVGRAPTLSEMREPSVSPHISTRQHVEVMKAPPAPPLYNQGQSQQMVGYGYQQQQPQQMMQQYYGAPNMGYGAPAY